MTNFKEGQTVWVTIKDELDGIIDVSGFMLVGAFHGYAVLCPFVFGIDNLRETMEYYIEQQQEWDDPQFFVFPLKDCYITREEAESAV